VRVVNPVTPGLGGPQVKKVAGWLARTGIRFSGDGWIPTFLVERGSQGHRHDEGEWEVIRTAGRELRPVFFLNPLGRGSAPGRNGSLEREEPAGNRLICEGFDPGSE
jgi:hypothetical protein